MTKLKEVINENIEAYEKLSLQDLRLKRFLELNNQIKELNKELSELKEEFKHRGSFSSNKYMCVVKESSRKSAPGLSKLIELYGPSVEQHCKETIYKTVTVTKKD